MRRWVCGIAVLVSGCSESGREVPLEYRDTQVDIADGPDTDGPDEGPDGGPDIAEDIAVDVAADVTDDVEVDGFETFETFETADTPDTPDTADTPDSIEETLADTLEDTVADTSPDILPDLFEDSFDPADQTPDTSPGDTLTGCETFAISPEKIFLEPLGFAVFTATGASDERRFDLVDNLVGATIHPLLGTFLAGPDSGLVTVRLRDPRCGERKAEVVVVEPLELLPALVSIEPSVGTVQLEVVGGSGQVEFELTAVGGHIPASSLSADGLLLAGGLTEDLLVRVHDLGTGRTRTSEVHVREGAHLVVTPAHLFLPMNESWRLALNGGSGRVDTSLVAGGGTLPDGTPATTPIVALADGVVTALVPGRAMLRIEDRHTGEVVPAVVEVLAAPSLPMNPAGDAKLTGQILVADLDGDSWPEAIFGVAESDVDAYDGGAVFVHRGVVDGFELEPALTLTSSWRLDELGTSLALGDFDDDGLLDLVVGVPLSDEGGIDRGAVKIYRGHPETFFEEVPSHTFIGEALSDQLGFAVSVCDFNGDGRLDLAMTARFAEDENQSPVASNAGAVFLHLGYAEGFLRSPDQVIFGALPEGQNLVPRANLNLGRVLASGDVDADQRCDLLVTSTAYSAGAGRSNDGLFMVYRGRGPDDFGPGGLEPRASLVVLGDEFDPGAQLGVSAAMGDVDGDGKADVLVGQPEYNRRVNNASRAGNGAAVMWPGHMVPVEGTTVVSVTTAPWRYVGRDTVNESGDRVGYAVGIGDLDGQDPLDVFIGSRLDEQTPQCSSNCGTVHALAGVLDLATATLPNTLLPTHVYPGDRGDQNFGAFLAVALDYDGDGLADLVGRASTDNRVAPRLGANLFRPSVATQPPVALSFPYASGGSRNGSAFAVVPDLDGDGLDELAVGAWRTQFDPATTAPHRPGEVALYRGTPQGVADTPFQRLGGFSGHATGDIFGHALSVTDFDGDGDTELAVVARADDTGNACAPARNDVGAVLLFEKTGSMLSAAPMTTLYGPQVSQQIQALVGADVNGDGLGDVVVGGTLWDREGVNDVGGVGIWLGGQVGNRCTLDATLIGAAAGDGLGTALVSLGDLDQDGCEDTAVGVPAADPPGASNAGLVYILWGFGPACDHQVPTRSAFSPMNANAQAGGALAADDLDGDGLFELAVGARRYSNGVETVGAVWLVEGRHLVSLLSQATPWVDGALPGVIAGAAPLGVMPTFLVGARREEDFGAAVGLVAGVGFENAWLVVGRPLSDLPGVDGAGAVTVHELRLANHNFSVLPVVPVAIGGETRRVRSEFARNLSAWRTAQGRVIAVGAGLSSALGLDDGAAFITRPR